MVSNIRNKQTTQYPHSLAVTSITFLMYLRKKTQNMRKLCLVVATSLFVVSCSENHQTEPINNKNTLPMDVHSAYQNSDARVSHLNLSLKADFDAHILQGTATWDVVSNGADTLYLDTRGLDITDIVDENGKELTYELQDYDSVLGQPLSIYGVANVKKVAITYTTSPQAEAIQWLEPEGKTPFMFTQSQAILARTWIPCPDSPGWRFTYEATIDVPNHLLALMSAENATEKNDEGIYHFRMEQSIPSYLMALAIGDVSFAPLSNRAGVFAEEHILEAAAWEFAETEDMIVAAEGLYGDYDWERYDILVLPASFPFGGMENPRLTFATPTIIAGDRSLTSLVAHELAHSWSGNLVTNATWNDFWINEGFTVYFEHRIMEVVYGRDYAEMLSALSRTDLIEEVADFMETRPEDTRLKLDLEGRNPDDGVSRIAYDKGYFFLRLIEETVGRDRFDAFLKTYFQTHRFGVMTTEMFLDYLRDNLISDDEWNAVGVSEWVYGKGLPDNLPAVESTRFANVDEAVKMALDGNKPDNTDQWSTHEWLRFIQGIHDNLTGDGRGILTTLDDWYGFTESGNSEILAAWWQPVIKHQYTEAYPAMETFLVNVGRRKFLTPAYRALKETDQIDVAKAIYEKARPNYHAVSRQTMDALLNHPPA